MSNEIWLDQPAVNLPVCQHMRNKSMLVTGERDAGGSADVHPGHCWCSRTQHVFGPDNQLVEPQLCVAGRGCYQAVL